MSLSRRGRMTLALGVRVLPQILGAVAIMDGRYREVFVPEREHRMLLRVQRAKDHDKGLSLLTMNKRVCRSLRLKGLLKRMVEPRLHLVAQTTHPAEMQKTAVAVAS